MEGGREREGDRKTERGEIEAYIWREGERDGERERGREGEG